MADILTYYISKWIRENKNLSILLFYYHCLWGYIRPRVGVGSGDDLAPNRWHVITLWWRHEMEIFSALLALCEGNPPVTGPILLGAWV